MSEIAKCPVCGRRLTGDVDGVVICWSGCSFRCGGYALPRIAAAMELAECEAWHVEAREAEWWASVRDQATWEDCVKVTGCARVAAQDARARCAEVFK